MPMVHRELGVGWGRGRKGAQYVGGSLNTQRIDDDSLAYVTEIS